MATSPLGIGKAFFDSKKVLRKMDPKKRRFLSRFGAFVRTGAKSSIKPGGKKNKTSEPGSPPRSHGRNLRGKIFFGLDFSSENVVIGPVVLSTKGGKGNLEALEGGGMMSFIDDGRKKRASIAARPFMLPAFEKERENIPQIWKIANPQ